MYYGETAWDVQVVQKTPHEIQSGHRYERGVTALVTMAEEVFGLEVPSDTAELWRNIFIGMYYLDDIVDSDKPKAQRWEDFDIALNYLELGEEDLDRFPPHVYEAFRNLRVSLSGLGEEKIHEFVTTGRQVAELGEQLRATKSAREMGRLAITEGRLTSKLFIVDTPLQPEERFNVYQKWLELLGGASNLVDSIFDLEADAKASRVGFAPRYRDYGVLLGQVGIESFKLLKDLNYKGVVSLIKLVPVTFTDRAR